MKINTCVIAGFYVGVPQVHSSIACIAMICVVSIQTLRPCAFADDAEQFFFVFAEYDIAAADMESVFVVVPPLLSSSSAASFHIFR